MLVSRTRSKLEALAAELEAAGASTRILAMDFAQNRDADYAALGDLLKGLDVSILVNNVGQSHAIPVPFLETPRAEMDGIIAVNCTATLRVTSLVAPLLAARKGRGLILTMASFSAACSPRPSSRHTPAARQLPGSTGPPPSPPSLRPPGWTFSRCSPTFVASAMSKIRRASADVVAPSPR